MTTASVPSSVNGIVIPGFLPPRGHKVRWAKRVMGTSLQGFWLVEGHGVCAKGNQQTLLH